MVSSHMKIKYFMYIEVRRETVPYLFFLVLRISIGYWSFSRVNVLLLLFICIGTILTTYATATQKT